MSNIITTENNSVPTISNQSNQQIMIDAIAKMVTDTNLDVDKMEKMLNLQIKMMDKQAEIEFNEALSQLQQEMPRISKTGENKHLKSKYMKYEDIDV